MTIDFNNNLLYRGSPPERDKEFSEHLLEINYLLDTDCLYCIKILSINNQPAK
jgi:hypothetical protein